MRVPQSWGTSFCEGWRKQGIGRQTNPIQAYTNPRSCHQSVKTCVPSFARMRRRDFGIHQSRFRCIPSILCFCSCRCAFYVVILNGVKDPRISPLLALTPYPVFPVKPSKPLNPSPNPTTPTKQAPSTPKIIPQKLAFSSIQFSKIKTVEKIQAQRHAGPKSFRNNTLPVTHFNGILYK